MADRGPNPDLWTVKAGPHQALKRVFYSKKFFIPKSSALSRASQALTSH